MTESTANTAEEMLRDIDETERSNFQATLEKILEQAESEKYSVVIVLLDEVDKPVLFPSEQSEKSILPDVTEHLRAATDSSGPVLYWGFDRIGLIQPNCDKKQMKSKVQAFLKAASKAEFDTLSESRPASIAVGVAAYPDDADNATDLIANAIAALKT